MRDHPAHVRAPDRAAAQRLLSKQERSQLVGETLHHAALVELLDIPPAIRAVDPKPLRIIRQRSEQRRQFLRPARRNVDAKISFSQRKSQLAFRRSDGDDGLRFREQSQKFTWEKRISGTGLLSNEADIGIDEQRPVITSELQRKQIEIRQLHFSRACGQRLSLRTIAADQQTNRPIAKQRGGLEQNLEALLHPEIT